ncbi:TPA: hypothetical protein U1C40_002357, partial [Streptococcus suis]|nr:hypothetical protein [Streptococcus suis]
MLEPYEGKLSRTVLREEGGSNTTNLLDYLDIGQEFGAEIITVAPGSSHHFNVLDLPDKEKLQVEDSDPIGQKVNLLSTLFENILTEFSDDDFSMIDRVTKQTYETVDQPTFKDWQA